MGTPAGSVGPAVKPRKRKVRRPPLLRISAWLQLAGTILIALLFVGLATVAYSTAGLKVTTPNGNAHQTSFGPNVVNQTSMVNLTNGGFLPITGLSFSALTYIRGGAVVGESSTPAVTISAGQVYHLPVVVSVNVGPGSPGQHLLVSAATLAVTGWLNGTFGYLLTISIGVTPSNQTNWGAPFAGFNVTATVAGTSANVTIRFSNQASIAVAGAMSVALTNTNGESCGVARIPVTANSGEQVSRSGTTSIVAGCVPATAVATLTSSAPGYTFTLPSVEVG